MDAPEEILRDRSEILFIDSGGWSGDYEFNSIPGKMYPANTVINLKKGRIKGCSTSPTMIGRQGKYEELLMDCEDHDGKVYRTRVVMNHHTGEVYDPNIHLPFEAMNCFWDKFARIELRPNITIGERNGSPRYDPDHLKLIGRSPTGMLYMSDVARDRHGTLYGLHRDPVSRY